VLAGRSSLTTMGAGVGEGVTVVTPPPMLCMPSQFHPRLVVGNDILGDMDVRLCPGLVVVPTICSIGRRHHRRQWLKHRRPAFPLSSITTSSRPHLPLPLHP